jgi:hypothetical protein
MCWEKWFAKRAKNDGAGMIAVQKFANRIKMEFMQITTGLRLKTKIARIANLFLKK